MGQRELIQRGSSSENFAAVLLLWNDRVVTGLERLRYVAERDAYTPPPLDEGPLDEEDRDA